ncbi:MAG TPA: phosphoribosyl-AMP cyclohydrolase [Lachnospiraceae bacterium]|nr:phosphoribosyl-AMP cyclohydrolase [Lachnospiraceae bacterium]
MFDLKTIHYNDQGLIPAVVQDMDSKRVLMVAWMNEESLMITLREKRTCFWSRSRKCLWRKGETSGHVQHVVSIEADCDEDTLLIQVHKDGPACHMGTDSCFDQHLVYEEGKEGY